MTKTDRFLALDKKPTLLKKLKSKYQQHYIRKRLDAIDLLWQGKSRPEVCKLVRCTYQSLDTWITTILEEGMDQGLVKLATPTNKTYSWRLPEEKRAEFRNIVLTKTPQDYGMDELVWTGRTLMQFLLENWGVEYQTSRIYEILSELGLSHQKAHRDYLDADPKKQRKYGKILKKSYGQSPAWG